MDIAQSVIQNQDKDKMLRRALDRIVKLYTSNSHFVYELLQNAEDAEAATVKFVQYESRLEFYHDGIPFTEGNLKSLCDIGNSDKVDNLNQIGEFGIGFKSVFGICDRVKLFSHPRSEKYPRISVQITDYITPSVIPDQRLPSGYSTAFIFPFSVGHSFSGYDDLGTLREEVSKRLENLGPTTLLFMKHLKKIEYEIHDLGVVFSGSYSLNKRVIGKNCVFVSSWGESDDKGKVEESYLLFSKPVPGTHKNRTVDIGFAATIREDGSFQFEDCKRPYLSVYFPTESESGLNFLVQGPYRTTPNRADVPSENKENQEIARQTTQLLVESMLQLRDMGKLNLSFLRLLPLSEWSLHGNSLFDGMASAVTEVFQTKAILPYRKGGYVDAEHARFAKDSISTLFDDQMISELIGDGESYHWLPAALSDRSGSYQRLCYFLANEIEVPALGLLDLKTYFNEGQDFLKKRDDAWLAKLYKQYEQYESAFNENATSSNMLTCCFIKTAKGDFVAPYRLSSSYPSSSYYSRRYGYGDFFRNIFLPTKNSGKLSNIHIVNQQVYKLCPEFFTKTLHLKKSGEFEDFVQKFVHTYDREAYRVPASEHVSDIKKLLAYREQNRNEANGLIKEYLALYCTKNGVRQCLNPGNTDVYVPVTQDGYQIQQYFEHIDERAYVDVAFYQKEGISYEDLKSLGVKDDISVERDTTGGRYYTHEPGGQPDWWTASNEPFRWQLSLDHLVDVLWYIKEHPDEATSRAKSAFIFQFLKDNAEKLYGQVFVGGSVGSFKGYAFIATVVRGERVRGNWVYDGAPFRDATWLYDKEGKLVSQKAITPYDLDPTLYGEVQPGNSVYAALGFKDDPRLHVRDGEKKALEQLKKEKEAEYDGLSAEQKYWFFSIALRRRYGLSVEELKQILEKQKGGNEKK